MFAPFYCLLWCQWRWAGGVIYYAQISFSLATRSVRMLVRFWVCGEGVILAQRLCKKEGFQKRSDSWCPDCCRTYKLSFSVQVSALFLVRFLLGNDWEHSPTSPFAWICFSFPLRWRTWLWRLSRRPRSETWLRMTSRRRTSSSASWEPLRSSWSRKPITCWT